MGAAGLTFELPAALQATEPPEARGLSRDAVRLLVSHLDGRIEHCRFRDLPRLLRAGDLLVVNASGTLSASLPAVRSDGARVELHYSTELPGHLHVVEVRRLEGESSFPFMVPLAGETIELPMGGVARLLAPYPFQGHTGAASRLWAATLELPQPLHRYLERCGTPIRYAHVPVSWPIEAYRTVFATEDGSAEMPSAGRPFTPALVASLRASGVTFAHIVLHTGVSSLEQHEPPYEERFLVPLETADLINRAHDEGHRVIAVGTTVVRALETVTDERGVTHPGRGWTSLIIGPDDDVRAVNGLITGLHEPKATHLAMLQAVTRRGPESKSLVLDAAYREAVDHGYLWHEFGDSHLILP
jgi:S-adenosylmethionine:tRNA ribosyltransferase-isomerase